LRCDAGKDGRTMMLEKHVSSADGKCTKCLRWIAAGEDYYEFRNGDHGTRFCWACGQCYIGGYRSAQEGKDEPESPPGKSDDGRIEWDDYDWMNACVRLSVPESGNVRLDAMIRRSNRLRAALAALKTGSFAEDVPASEVACYAKEAFEAADAVLAAEGKGTELAGTDEYPACGMCNTLLNPADESYCPNPHCQRYPGPEVVRAKKARDPLARYTMHAASESGKEPHDVRQADS
jgi:hypothetical protein